MLGLLAEGRGWTQGPTRQAAQGQGPQGEEGWAPAKAEGHSLSPSHPPPDIPSAPSRHPLPGLSPPSPRRPPAAQAPSLGVLQRWTPATPAPASTEAGVRMAAGPTCASAQRASSATTVRQVEVQAPCSSRDPTSGPTSGPLLAAFLCPCWEPQHSFEAPHLLHLHLPPHSPTSHQRDSSGPTSTRPLALRSQACDGPHVLALASFPLEHSPQSAQCGAPQGPGPG